MLRFKITRPALPPCTERAAAIARALEAPISVLTAPAGHGKTCTAAQIADASGGPVAWYTADELDRDRTGVVTHVFGALGFAWGELAGAVPDTLDDDVAVPMLGGALETLAGPGCLVLDDVHLLPAEVAEAVLGMIVATLPPTCRLIICGRGEPEVPLVRAQAAGRAVVLDAVDLAFTVEECARLLGSAELGAVVCERTGGWPLAVALDARTPLASAETHAGPREPAGLVDIALGELPPTARDLLVVLARLPRLPGPLMVQLDDAGARLGPFARQNPNLFERSADDWWSMRLWLRDALADLATKPSLVDRVVGALRDLGEHELSTHLLLAVGRHEQAVPEIEGLVRDAMRRGRYVWALSVMAPIPDAARTLTLDVLTAEASQGINLERVAADRAWEVVLQELVDRTAAEQAPTQMRAQALLADHYRMAADARLFAVCVNALGDAIHSTDPSRELLGRWEGDELAPAAQMLRLYGQALLLADDGAVVERGRRLVTAALDLLDGAGWSTVSPRTWAIWAEALLYLRRPADAVGPVRAGAHRLLELGHTDGALRLAELAILEMYALEYAASRRTIEIARECAEQTANRVVLAPLAGIEAALDVIEDGLTTDRRQRFDEAVAELGFNPRLRLYVGPFAAEFGAVLVQAGSLDEAEQYLDQSRMANQGSLLAHVASFGTRRLEALLLLARREREAGRELLRAVQAEALAEGRVALVELIEGDLARDGRPSGEFPAPSPRPPVLVRVFGPEFDIAVDGERTPLRGYPAKLLALLVAAEGSMTIDAAVEGLWPDCDPDVGRNRLHGVLLRLRRGLGLPVDGPVTCTDGLVRLETGGQLEVDAWEFERLASRPDTQDAAIAHYGGDVLAHQFAYDDHIDGYRRSLRLAFVRLAVARLSDPPAEWPADDRASLARRLWEAAPDDDTLCRLAAATLAAAGQRAEAIDLVDRTATILIDLGVDGASFQRTALAELD